MTPEEQRRRASERFDEPERPSPECASEQEAWDDWALIADHLEKADVVALPSDFAKQVQCAIRRAQTRRDVALVLQTAGVTGLVLTCITAWALGLNWWERLLATVQPGNLATLVPTLPLEVPTDAPDPAALYAMAEPLLRLLPPALVCAATLVLLIEFAVFRLLRLGPFHLKPSILGNPHDSVS